MLTDYPKRSVQIEVGLQIALAIAGLAILAFYSTVVSYHLEAGGSERLEILIEAAQSCGLAFLLAIAAGLLRRFVRNPPLPFIWAALLVVAAVSGVLGCLTVLSAV